MYKKSFHKHIIINKNSSPEQLAFLTKNFLFDQVLPKEVMNKQALHSPQLLQHDHRPLYLCKTLSIPRQI